MNETASSFVQLVVFAVRRAAFQTMVVGQRVHTVAELQQQIHHDLRSQHPEWVGPSGESPMCDFYEARLTQLLEACAQSGAAKVA